MVTSTSPCKIISRKIKIGTRITTWNYCKSIWLQCNSWYISC